jgi:hypothetical protein
MNEVRNLLSRPRTISGRSFRPRCLADAPQRRLLCGKAGRFSVGYRDLPAAGIGRSVDHDMAPLMSPWAKAAQAYDGPWHDLAHSSRISANNRETVRMGKTLMIKGLWKSLNNSRGLKMASQAYDEGSIPFTRSKISQLQRHITMGRMPRRWRRGSATRTRRKDRA